MFAIFCSINIRTIHVLIFPVCFMVDTARVNAQTLWKLKGNVVRDSRSFGFDIVRGLVTPHILQRMVKPGIQNFVKLSAAVFLGNTCHCRFYLLPTNCYLKPLTVGHTAMILPKILLFTGNIIYRFNDLIWISQICLSPSPLLILFTVKMHKIHFFL